MRRGGSYRDRLLLRYLPKMLELDREVTGVLSRVVKRGLVPLGDDTVARICDQAVPRLGSSRRYSRTGSSALARPEVVREIVRRALELCRKDPLTAERVALRAATLARRLRERFPTLVAADLEAEAFGVVANALRVQERFGDAGRAWEVVDEILKEGSDDPLLSARLDSLRAVYLISRRQLAEAVRLTRRSVATIHRYGHRSDALAPAVGLARALYIQGHFAEALQPLARAGKGVSPEAAGPLRLMVLHNTALFLTELKDYRRAAFVLYQAEPLYASEASPNLLLQKQWLEGKLLAGRREWKPAEERFRELRERYLGMSRPLDGALVGLDQMLCLAELRDWGPVAKLAPAVLDAFLELELEDEARKAVEQLEQACADYRADVEMVRRLHELLQPVRRLPIRREHPSAGESTRAE